MAGISLDVRRGYRHPWALSVVIVLGVLGLMEALVASGAVSEIVLQRPTRIFAFVYSGVQTPAVQTDITMSAFRVFITFVISLVGGTVITFLLWRYDLLRRTYLPLLGALFGTPYVLMYLVLVVMFGRGTATIVIMSIPNGVVPVVINSVDALASVNQAYIDVGRSFNATRGQMIRKILVPAVAPGIFTGIRIGFSYIMIGVIALEFLLVTNRGVGGLISNAYFRFNNVELFGGIVMVIGIIMVAIFSLRRIEEAIRR